jgi:integrase
MVIIMAGTVVRESELLALKWTDFDWQRRVITVRRSLYRKKLDATKSEKGSRDIPYGERVSEAVLSLRDSPHNRGEFLFLTDRGKIYDPRVAERLGFASIIEKFDIAPFTWRSFRRSGATALHVNNIPLKVQQDVMGHANPEMSLLYTEAELAYRRSAIKLLEKTVFGTHNETLTDANGRELAVQGPSIRPNPLILNTRL